MESIINTLRGDMYGQHNVKRWDSLVDASLCNGTLAVD